LYRGSREEIGLRKLACYIKKQVLPDLFILIVYEKKLKEVCQKTIGRRFDDQGQVPNINKELQGIKVFLIIQYY
jgi:hypothetical protein